MSSKSRSPSPCGSTPTSPARSGASGQSTPSRNSSRGSSRNKSSRPESSDREGRSPNTQFHAVQTMDESVHKKRKKKGKSRKNQNIGTSDGDESNALGVTVTPSSPDPANNNNDNGTNGESTLIDPDSARLVPYTGGQLDTHEVALPSQTIFCTNFTPATNINIGDKCCWWRSRSSQCSKCHVQPLCQRPKHKGGGYGLKKNEKDKVSTQGNFKNTKIAVGLCSVCNENDALLNWNECEPEHGEKEKHKACRKGSISKQNDIMVSEYRSSYRHPKSRKIRKTGLKSIKLNDERMLRLMHKLYSRPPWNHDTRVPPPLPYETLGTSEAKVNELEIILAQSSIEMEYISTTGTKKTNKANQQKTYKTNELKTSITNQRTTGKTNELKTSKTNQQKTNKTNKQTTSKTKKKTKKSKKKPQSENLKEKNAEASSDYDSESGIDDSEKSHYSSYQHSTLDSLFIGTDSIHSSATPPSTV